MTSQQPDEDRRTASPREKPTTNAQSQSKTPDVSIELFSSQNEK
jgi:hypothetical protein